MLIYSNEEGVVLEQGESKFLIPYASLPAVHEALTTTSCRDHNVYLSPCACVRHGANAAEPAHPHHLVRREL